MPLKNKKKVPWGSKKTNRPEKFRIEVNDSKRTEDLGPGREQWISLKYQNVWCRN